MNLHDAFVFLCAAVIAVPIAKRLGLGSVLGYLLAGVVIGPFALKFVGDKGGDVLHTAELGVVMMLFLIGLELQPSLLWQLRRPIVGLGGAQVVLTTAAIAGVAVALGVPFGGAIALGMILSLSSTAIVLQTLAEKGWEKGEGGRASFSVLLFQDIAVIPMIALLPFLGSGASVEDPNAPPSWLRAIFVVAAVVAIVVAGRYVVRPVFRAIAKTGLREIFTAAALLLVIGTALLMEMVGLSQALGTFLAGVVLADSEYRRELEGDIEPFKALLLGLFFIAVGASINFGLILQKPVLIALCVAGLVVIKIGVLYILAHAFKMARYSRALFAFALAQGGEFAFVLATYAKNAGAIDAEQTGILIAIVALSMLFTPLLFVIFERLIAPRIGDDKPTRPHDEIDATTARW